MTSAERLTDVLIIGGGCGAIAAAAALSKAAPALSSVIVEKSARVGLGIAYGTEIKHHILNVPAKVMGIYQTDPEHFLKWGAQHEVKFGAEEFVSRQIFGEYLQHILANDIIATGHHSILQSEIVSLSREGELFYAQGANGEQIQARYVILATGHHSLQLPVKNIVGSIDERLVQNPWGAAGYQNLGSIKRVAVLGAGLTAMDVVGGLDKLGYQGEIVLFSRRGLLPCPTADSTSTTVVAFDQEVLTQPLRMLVSSIRARLLELSRAGDDWRLVIDALRPHIAGLWRRFSEFERGQFIRHVRPYWDVARHRMPLEVHCRIEELRSNGRLTINRGRIGALDFSNASKIKLSWSRGGKSNSEEFDRVFNCAGSAALDARKLPPLLESLRKNGLIQLDRFGLGFHTSSSGELIGERNTQVKRCFLIGPPRRASEWESTALREIRQQAYQVALQIAADR